jgi:hypothetical protein
VRPEERALEEVGQRGRGLQLQRLDGRWRGLERSRCWAISP